MKEKVVTTQNKELGKELYVKDEKQGGYTVWFEDFPNIISEGKTLKDAHINLWNTVYDILKHFTKNDI